MQQKQKNCENMQKAGNWKRKTKVKQNLFKAQNVPLAKSSNIFCNIWRFGYLAFLMQQSRQSYQNNLFFMNNKLIRLKYSNVRLLARCLPQRGSWVRIWASHAWETLS
jgi:hypothetical protein